MIITKQKLTFISICALILGIASSGSHPTSGNSGYTGAPGDSVCSTCHNGNNTALDGNITINGLPSSIMPNTEYPLTVVVSNPNGNAIRAGFQLLVLGGTNLNTGTIANFPSNTELKTVAGGKKYLGHSPAEVFPASNELSYDFTWTSPASPTSNPVIKFYASTVIANGNGSSSGDRFTLFSEIIPFETTMPSLSVSITNVSPPLCNDSADGTATAVVSGGTSPFNYSWTNGVTTAINNFLPGGNEVVTVTDALGAFATANVVLNAPPPVNALAFGSTVCNGNSNGNVSVTPSGGVGGFTYLWDNGNTNSAQSNLPAGNYTVTVTDSNGCFDFSTATINTSPNINITAIVNDVTCFSGGNGSINVSVSGGTFPFTYLWSNNATTQDISNVPAGTYIITATDAALCNSSMSFTVNQPDELDFTIEVTQEISCNGENDGMLTVTTTGGTPPYTYFWSNGVTGTGQTHSISNLPEGEYFVVVRDLFDCGFEKVINLTEPDPLMINIVQLTEPTCFGFDDGSVEIEVIGGSGDYTYEWNNGVTTPFLDNISGNNYNVLVTDNNTGCTGSEIIIVDNPSQIVVNFTNIILVSCGGDSDGAATAMATGDNSIVSYLWSNNGTTQTQNNLSAGIYTVTVTDVVGCTGLGTINLQEPNSLSYQVIHNIPSNCATSSNGVLEVKGSAGVSPYTYLWSNGATEQRIDSLSPGVYTLSITDANLCLLVQSFTVEAAAPFVITIDSVNTIICNGDSTGYASTPIIENFEYLWSNGSTNYYIDSIPSGSYSVQAFDTLGCASQITTVEVTENLPLIANIVSADTLLCYGDSLGYIMVNPSGGVGPYIGSWFNGSPFLLDSVPCGVYAYYISDANNCDRAIEFTVQCTNPVIDTLLVENISCNGMVDGSIALFVSGGIDTLIYQWSNDGESNFIDSLSNGSYFITITDGNGCSTIDTFIIIEPDTFHLDISVINESDAGSSDGSITIDVTGGTAPYSIIWSTSDTTFTIDNLSPGLYSYTITDSNNCQTSGWEIVSGGQCALNATYSLTNSTCYNSYDGAINLEVTGANGPWTYQLFQNQNLINAPLDSLSAANYTVIIQDTLNCIVLLNNIELESTYPAITFDSLIITQPSSSSAMDGSLGIYLSGGVSPFSYSWTKDINVISTRQIADNLGAGLYSVQVVDSVGCTFSRNNIILTATSNVNEQLEFDRGILILPNPINNDFTINSSLPIHHLSVYALDGKQLFSKSYSSEYSIKLQKELINVYHSGAYFIRINSGSNYTTKKIIIIE